MEIKSNMENRKKRILFVGEASYLATGFSTYWNEVLKRLYESGEFSIAELGSYGKDNDPQIRNVSWKFYPVQPDPKDEEANRIFNSNRTNQFGELRFDHVCLDFKPDIVVSLRDFWMDEFILRSPFRDKFCFCWQPTVDGIPQKEQWLDGYSFCDKVLTYSKWGFDVLKKTGRPNTNLITVASPGADIEMFKPVEDKRAHKSKSGIDPDSIVVGTVMRNQARKLYYDLIEDFSKWVHKAKSKGQIEIAKKTFLYLHTSYPDQGWDIGAAIKEFKMGNKVLMTYLCSKCHVAFPSFFKGELTYCPSCKSMSAKPPNAGHHCSRKVLADIMNIFDLYVQYSVCEGFGMPILEAQSCGVPTMAVRYSAMEDHLENPTSIPIEVGKFFREGVTATEQKRALPDSQDFINKLNNFVKLSEEKRKEISKKTRQYVLDKVDTYGTDKKMPRSSWERTTEIWRNALNECEIKGIENTWLNPKLEFHKPDLTDINKSMNNTEFARWVIRDIWGRPEMQHTYFTGQWIKGLNVGYLLSNHQMTPMDRQKMIDHFMKLVKEKESAEKFRLKLISKSNNNSDEIELVRI